MSLRSLPKLQCMYQPVVTLRESDRAQDGVVVGYEALSRVRPEGSDGASHADRTPDAPPDVSVEEIDRACRLAALRGALDARLGPACTLLLNVEPSTRSLEPRTGRERDLFAMAQRSLRVAIEVTERAVLDYPGNVLRHVRFARSCGWGVAVDDVGSNPDSLAMLPFIAPDVIKLDLSLIQQTPDREQARTITAVLAHTERTNATVLAEGVETADHLEQARSLGATLFQGWLFGHPAPLPRFAVG